MMIVSREQVLQRWDSTPDLIKEAVYSPTNNDTLANISSSFHLSEERHRDLAYLCLLVFFGFIHLQDLYREIKNSLGIDARIALDIYHELDQKIFSPFHKEIEENYLKFKMGVTRPEEVTEPAVGPSQIVLKKEPASVLNLKPEIPRLAEEYQSSGQAPAAEPKRIEVSQMERGTKPVTPPATGVQPAPAKPEESGLEMGPMIIHKEEESESISQVRATDAFKQNTFGGFRGSFKAPTIARPQETVSRAEVEMPTTKKAEAGEMGKIPVVVKKYEEQPKTIHYGVFRTELKPKESDKSGDDGKTIDLSKL
ncbi:MAG: hypothetical protein UV58_C0005G0011 [Candidatus Wolfebacteria bacterium GW2011_GWC1_43_10]|uniref:Uncharacterized protein n=2 Tax=Candidatus Wolfeibacteriota TaxID=1752735 RepID=A0A0G1CB38_9BACT|nr:MAG: hypothetical protein UV58_C0005G0011 [Candidatus Wolfebacteria bacterium GW2011_GWC1_43_10]KKT23145.1 MAG: hypothetical protein UW08_C0001G0108 [Parcubacteria group bacterium GW2011_GWB1_43_8b]OGM89261.1 MAG: hypothetical protein A2108_00090 [Candidatus Wolfebacteria bacterium GWA1_42_9]